MKTKLSLLAVLLMLASACGGGSAGTAASSGGSTGGDSSDTGTTGSASVSSLNTLPDTDISNIDYSSQSSSSQSFSSSNVSALVKSVETAPAKAKFLGEMVNKTGNPSRAGCEYNMMKKEIKRQGAMTTQPKCAASVMAEFGLIEMPESGKTTKYLIVPPDFEEEDQASFCDDIPDEAVEEKEHCLSGEGPGGPGGDILMTITATTAGGRELDVCEDGDKIMEGDYTASGTVYTLGVRSIFKGFFEVAGEDKMSFEGRVDIGTDGKGKVEESVVTLGGDGEATITLSHEGTFGKGRMIFHADAAKKENEMKAFWHGEFTDPFSEVSNSFEDKVYALVGQLTGCAKFAFTGGMPPESIENMIPPDMPSDQKPSFLQGMSGEVGYEITEENAHETFFCMNPNYDWNNPDPAKKPMIILQAGETSCPAVTHTDVECFGILNATVKKKLGDFGAKKKQVFSLIELSAASQYATVNAFDLATISTTVPTPAYTRSASCDATGATEVLFSKLTPKNASQFQEKIEKCFEFGEDSRGEGMEDHDCGGQVMKQATNDFAEAGPPAWCYAGGDHQLKANQPTQCPTLFFNGCLDDENSDGTGGYCMPYYAGCTEYDLVNKVAAGLSMPINTQQSGEATVTSVNFSGGTTACQDLSAVFAVEGGPTVTCNYTCSQPTFNAPPPEEGHDYVEGAEAGEAGFVHPACAEAGITDLEVCQGYCIAVGCEDEAP